MAIKARKKAPTNDIEADLMAKAEATPISRTVEERIATRAEGRYFTLLTYRGTEEQKDLIDFAAATERMSIQKLLEGIIMPYLEEKYGENFDNQ
ncbi:hypothetical protein CMUST_15625 (plasmid) [Corynebacterium mustelae]|uniref:ParB n=1 Tax=Corynebacterium mustelae TaxID=571915 RepID=A0A0G3H1X3_9CORY|nr:hypothetical protein [Corynebacterium mustelae]AKK07414.1 hypothetical protein CMUST_15625 [Corynebacterium mustelae]